MKSHELSDDEIDARLKRSRDAIQLYEQADAKLADRILEKMAWRHKATKIDHNGKNLFELLLIKSLSAKEIVQQLETFVHFKLYDSINVFVNQLKTNRQFNDCVLDCPLSFLIEEKLFEYCVNHPEDKEIVAFEAEYKVHQYSADGIIKRNHFLSERLRELYGFPKSPHSLTKDQQDLLNIALFLMDKNRVMKRLNELEEFVEVEAKKADKLEEGTNNHLKGYVEGKPYKHHKFLSTLLYKLAKDAGFGEPIKIEDVLDPESFFNMFKDKRLFKDKAFGGKIHGEWTHFIQWMCIVLEYNDSLKNKSESKNESKANETFLTKSPAELYQWFGRPEGVRFWDPTFETPVGLSRSGWDARNVVRFDEYLRGPQSSLRFPILQQLLQGRANAREVKENQAKSTVAILKGVCAQHPENKHVNELKDVLGQYEDANRLLRFFVKAYQPEKNAYPADFIRQVQEQLPPRKKR